MIFSGSIFSQDLNDYKYIIVPESYDILGKTNQYQLNALTKFLFEKQGFETIMKSEAWPEDLQKNPCLGVSPVLVEDSGLFVTKVAIQLQDCKGTIIYKTRDGRSKQKEFEAAYQESLKDAFQDLANLQYKYTPNSNIAETAQVRKNNTTIQSEEKISISEDEVNENSTSEKAANLKTPASNDLTAIKEKEKKLSSLENSHWTYDGAVFELKINNSNYALYQLKAPEPLALILRTEKPNEFLYRSLLNSGTATFVPGEGLRITYFDSETNQQKSLILQPKD